MRPSLLPLLPSANFNRYVTLHRISNGPLEGVSRSGSRSQRRLSSAFTLPELEKGRSLLNEGSPFLPCPFPIPIFRFIPYIIIYYSIMHKTSFFDARASS